MDPESLVVKESIIQMTLFLNEAPIAYCNHDIQPFLERATSGDSSQGMQMVGNTLTFTCKTSLPWYEVTATEYD